MIVGGVCPNKPLSLAAGKEIGTDYFLARRMSAIINVGSRNAVAVDGEKYSLDTTDGRWNMIKNPSSAAWSWEKPLCATTAGGSFFGVIWPTPTYQRCQVEVESFET